MLKNNISRLAFFLLAAVLPVALAGCCSDKEAPAAAKAVSVVQVQTQTYATGLEYTGLV